MNEIGFIDWDAAVETAAKIGPAGPTLSTDEAAEAVASLRQAAEQAIGHVREVTGLTTPAPAQTLVVDRASWVKACAASIATMLGTPAAPDGQRQAFLGHVSGSQVGAVLAAVSTRILGQFDPFGEPARLLLVAPNVVTVERSLKVVPADFRLWVCLHEQTHRFQFGQAPWLRDHLLDRIRQLIEEESRFALRSPGGRKPDGASAPGSSGRAFLDRVLTPSARVLFDELTAVMSLVEGYADVMMDRVGAEVVPTLPAIRRAFEARRDRGGWTAILGRLLGNDLKLAQYREGAAFCRAVMELSDVASLNAAWSAPDALPTLAEIRGSGEPAEPIGTAWLRRVHG